MKFSQKEEELFETLAQKSILCLWDMQPGVMSAQEREILNLIFRVKKFTFSSFYMELEVFFTII
jgi:hypothetical protein